MFDQILGKVVGAIFFCVVYWLLIKAISYVFSISVKRAAKYLSICVGSVFMIFFIWIMTSFLLKKYKDPNSEISNLQKIGAAPSFKLTDQNGKSISNADYKDKVYILEFFFASCPSICPKMNKNMVDIQNQFFGNPNFGIVSITIDPEHDTPGVLKEHANLLGVKSSNWHFLTGDKKYIYDLANKGFNLYAGENSKVNGGFEHSGLFALIDKDGNIRCRKDENGNPILYYDGIEKEGVKAIQQDIAILLRE